MVRRTQPGRGGWDGARGRGRGPHAGRCEQPAAEAVGTIPGHAIGLMPVRQGLRAADHRGCGRGLTQQGIAGLDAAPAGRRVPPRARVLLEEMERDHASTFPRLAVRSHSSPSPLPAGDPLPDERRLRRPGSGRLLPRSDLHRANLTARIGKEVVARGFKQTPGGGPTTRPSPCTGWECGSPGQRISEATPTASSSSHVRGRKDSTKGCLVHHDRPLQVVTVSALLPG